MSPVAESVCSPEPSECADSLGSVDSLTRAAAEQAARREAEIKREQSEKARWQAEIEAKQSKTSTILAEIQKRKEAEVVAEAQRIEAERIAAAKKKAEAVLMFEEQRKLRAMTEEQRAAYFAEKAAKEEALRREAEEKLRREAEERERVRLARELAEREAEAERLRIIAEEERARELEQIAMERAEAEQAASIALPPPSPVSTINEPVSMPSAESMTVVDEANESESPPTYHNAVKAELSQDSSTMKVSEQISHVDVTVPVEQSQKKTFPDQLTNQTQLSKPLPTQPHQSQSNRSPSTPAKKRRSSWFCCGSAMDETESIPAESQPAVRR